MDLNSLGVWERESHSRQDLYLGHSHYSFIRSVDENISHHCCLKHKHTVSSCSVVLVKLMEKRIRHSSH